MAFTKFESHGFESTDNYVARGNTGLAHIFESRTLDNAVSYLRPVLESLPPNFTFLDVGLGPASITISIARAFPKSTIVGLDMPDALAIAKANIAKAGLTNIRLVPGDALDIKAAAARKVMLTVTNTTSATEGPNGNDGVEAFTPAIAALFERGFDVVHTHQVHPHVRDAAALMRALRDAARPSGGLVCCREIDVGLSVMWPRNALLEEQMRLFGRLLVANGNDPHVGRKLLSHALAAGFRREHVIATFSTSDFSLPAQRRTFADVNMTFLSEEYFERSPDVCRAVGVTPEFMREASEAWQKWVEEAEDGIATLGSGEVVCRRHE